MTDTVTPDHHHPAYLVTAPDDDGSRRVFYDLARLSEQVTDTFEQRYPRADSAYSTGFWDAITLVTALIDDSVISISLDTDIEV